MNFDDIRAFVAVARRGSFSLAAVDLCIVQSALSKRVQRLEGHMGVPLLQRHARGVLLTASGVSFLSRAEALVKEVEELERNLSIYSQTPSGLVCLAFPQRTCGLVAPTLIERVGSDLPLVRINILEGTPTDVHNWLMEAHADIAITYNPELGSGFTVKSFATEPLFLFCSQKQAEACFPDGIPASCSISSLKGIPLILPRKPHPLRLLIERTAIGHDFRPNICHEIDGPTTTRGMVIRGMGCSLFTLSGAWKDVVHSKELIAIPFHSPAISWTLHIASASQAIESPAVNGVLRILNEVLEELFLDGAWPDARRRY